MDALSGRTGSGSEARSLGLLDALPGVGPRTVARLVSAFGSAEAALTAARDRFERVAGKEAEVARRDRSIRAAVDRGFDEAHRRGMTVITWNDAAYPQPMRHLADPPPVMFALGHVELLDRPGVAVVGGRRATVRGRDVAQRLGAALGRAGASVVSGLALGIDAAAHRGALQASGATIAVLGCGADLPYPRSNARLHSDIAERGLLVSEFLPGTPPLPHHFPRRNRILAALSHSVVVVEAARRSGSLITVDHALDLGLDVWAVPGPIDSAVNEGSNALLTDGARALVSVDRFVAEVVGPGPAGVEYAHAAGDGPDPLETASPTGPDERALLGSLDGDAAHVDTIAARAGLPVPRVLAMLTALEFRGRVVRAPGLRFRRAH